MMYKRIMVLVIFVVSLLAVSAVSAADNATSDFVIANDSNEVNNIEDIADVTDLENNNMMDDNVANNKDVLSSVESQDKISFDNDDDFLSEMSPFASDYGYGKCNVAVHVSEVEWGTTGYIMVSFESCAYEGFYAYDFYVNIEDSNGNQKMSQRYQGKTYTISLTHSFSSTPLIGGNYIVKIVNFRDKVVMATATFTVKN